MKRKATITVETERLLVFSNSRVGFKEWCATCATEVDFVTVEAAAALAGTTQRNIFNLAEAGRIHLLETAAGRALFCANSLTKLLAQQQGDMK